MKTIDYNDSNKIKMEKFKIKNGDNLEFFSKFVEDNIDNIYLILVSHEMKLYIQNILDCEDKDTVNVFFKGKRLQTMDWFPADYVNFAFKDKGIRFNLPCVCGCYSDEEHNKLK